MRKLQNWVLLPVLVLAVAACGGGDNEAQKGEAASSTTASQTLTAVLDGDGSLNAMKAMVANAGLADVLAGKGPYTVFAPSNAALGAVGTDLSGETMKAQSAAMLRAHIVPGALTRGDILVAIERSATGKPQMRTMADGLLTFSNDADAIVVTAEDGTTVRLTGNETVASNGVVHFVDGVLIKVE